MYLCLCGINFWDVEIDVYFFEVLKIYVLRIRGREE